MDLWLQGQKMGQTLTPHRVRNVHVKKAPKASIIGSLTEKSLRKHVKNGSKWLKLWLFSTIYKVSEFEEALKTDQLLSF